MTVLRVFLALYPPVEQVMASFCGTFIYMHTFEAYQVADKVMSS